jgi:hypothetical protein
LGGLISLTLFGMLSNLMLLPALVLTLNKTLANEHFIEPKIDIIEPSDAAIDDLELENNIRALPFVFAIFLF